MCLTEVWKDVLDRRSGHGAALSALTSFVSVHKILGLAKITSCNFVLFPLQSP